MDISNKNSLEENGHELISLLNNQSLNHKPILIFANKNDQPDAMDIDQISEYFCLSDLND